MKCEKCGKNEASFFYKSNINGHVNEKHLCAECASSLGLEDDLFSASESLFEEMLTPFFSRRHSLFDTFPSFGGLGFAMPTLLMPRIDITLAEEKSEKASDPEMAKKREINSLRAKMHEAAAAEDYEKAAEIRDKIKSLEEPSEEKKPEKSE